MTENYNNEKLWSKSFILVSLVNFIIMLSMYLLLVTIGGYAVDEYSVSKSLAGLVSGIFIIGSLFGRLYAGKYISILGQKKILIIGTLIFFFTTLLYLVTFNLSILFIVRFINGIGSGIASTATGTIAALVTPMNRRGEGISYFSMSTVMATAVGPFLGLMLLQYIGFSSLFIICSVIALLAVVMLPLIQVTEQEPIAPTTKIKALALSQFIDKNALPIGFVVLVICTAYSSVLSFISFFTKENDLVQTGSFFFLAYAIIVLLSRPVTGKLLDSKGTNIVMIPSLVSFIIGLLLLSVTHNSFILLLSAIFIGLGYGNFQSIAQAIAVKVTEPSKIGLATSTFYIFLDFALGFGPYLLGFVIPTTGMHGLYLTMAILVVFGLALYMIIYGKKAHVYDRK